MNAQPASDSARTFYRSEAFPEDVADLMESATLIAAKRRRPSSSRLWLLTLLPVGAVALATAVALIQRLF
jgi:hypothetical protein